MTDICMLDHDCVWLAMHGDYIVTIFLTFRFVGGGREIQLSGEKQKAAIVQQFVHLP